MGCFLIDPDDESAHNREANRLMPSTTIFEECERSLILSMACVDRSDVNTAPQYWMEILRFSLGCSLLSSSIPRVLSSKNNNNEGSVARVEQ